MVNGIKIKALKVIKQIIAWHCDKGKEMKEFNWETAEYPCLGKNISTHDEKVICFSKYGVGHNVDELFDVSHNWDMANFKPYTPPKPKTKLWYFEYLNSDNEWFQSNRRMTEEQAKDYFHSDKNYKKLEGLDFIEVEE